MSGVRSSNSNMDNSGSSRYKSFPDESNYRCSCGFQLRIQTSMTRKNPGRRFIACPIRGNGKCNFFLWLDPQLPSQSLEVVHMLYDRIDRYEQQIARINDNNARSKKILKFIILFF